MPSPEEAADCYRQSCRQCAKHRVAVRPMGLLHAAGKGLGESAPRAAWYLVLWSLVLSLFSHFFGGHHDV